MKYIVSRTSRGYYDNEVPCEGALKSMHANWHIRTCNEEEFNKRFSTREGLWRSKGTEHHVTSNGHIARRGKDKAYWTIEINTLEELFNFSIEHGEIIIRAFTFKDESPSIEIYDDYRE